MKLKILFIGWNDNGQKCLQKLVNHQYNITGVVVPEGYETTPMLKIAQSNNISFFQISRKSLELEKIIAKHNPNLIIVASYPYLLPSNIINYPKYGVLNVHTSALPKYRGYHPLNWAIIHDEQALGVTVHYLTQGMDSGNILAQKVIPLSNHDNVNTIRSKLTTLGANLLLNTLNKLKNSTVYIPGTPQLDSQTSFAPKRYPNDGIINWANNTRDIFNLIRALTSPYPNAFTFDQNGRQVEIIKSFVDTSPGRILAKYKKFYLVSTGDGVILIKTKTVLSIGEQLKIK